MTMAFQLGVSLPATRHTRHTHPMHSFALPPPPPCRAAGALDDDDPVGRVAIQPCNLRPNTLIDCWWPLQHRPVGERPGARGSLRLRICVQWTSERTLLTQPASLLADSLPANQSGHPAFTLRLSSRRALAAVTYAFNGSEPDTRYSYNHA